MRINNSHSYRYNANSFDLLFLFSVLGKLSAAASELRCMGRDLHGDWNLRKSSRFNTVALCLYNVLSYSIVHVRA